jgi:hypothetical protein
MRAQQHVHMHTIRSHWPEIYSPAYVSGASDSAVKSSDSAAPPPRRGSLCKWRPPATGTPHPEHAGGMVTVGQQQVRCAVQGESAHRAGRLTGHRLWPRGCTAADLGRVGGWPGTVALRRRMSSPCTKAATRTFRNLGELHKSGIQRPVTWRLGGQCTKLG